MTTDEVFSLFRATGALLEGHFQLTSGLHSPSYFQCARVLQYPDKAGLLCGIIARRFHASALDAVVAPALGGIVVGQEVARQLGVRSMFCERKDGSMQLRRGFVIRPEERILVCEDVVTTGGSVGEVLDIVRASGAVVAGVAAIVDRSGGSGRVPGLVAVMTMDVVTYVPAECPLCAGGIALEKPGSRNSGP